MKFSKETINILKNFASVNSGIMLKKGNFIMTRAVNGTSYCESTISDEINFDVALYDLPGFLSILSLVGESAEITLDERMSNIEIKNGRSTINWPSCDPSTIVFPPKPATFPVAKVIFDLPADELKQLLRVARGLQIDTIAIESVDGKILINGYNKIADAKCEKALYSLIVADYDEEEKFKMLLNLSNLKMVDGDYKVMVWGSNSPKKQGAVRFEGSAANYVVVIESDSEFDF